ncbi:phage scaffolding protein [Xanthomonas sp. MUS 060]|uniref:phage scaffolding protein n=1 Tax=Xanthomonas sp. MUS 060 TaxID=1588031 RepID=UPI0005F28447|nr:phage scaffolding protein [Xanthomonas sp. MUS 060]
MTNQNDNPSTTPAPAHTPAPAAPAPTEMGTFSEDYVKELRRECAHYRTKAKDGEETAEKALKNAQESIAKAKADADDRIVRAELKTAALKAGMIDIDGLKLADLSKVTLKDDGTLEGVDALMEGMKKDKPYLFGQPATTSHPGRAPDPNPPTPKNAMEMSAEEWQAAKQLHISKR